MVRFQLGFALAALIGSMAVFPACQNYSVPERADHRLSYVQTEIALGRQSVQNTTASLKTVRDASASQLPNAINAYHQAVTGLNEKAGGVGLVLGATESKANDYFANWQKGIGTMDDDDMREAAADRRAEVVARYNDVQARIDRLRGDFRPFMGKLQEIDKSLAANPTANGQAAAAPAIQHVLGDEKIVLDDIDQLDKALYRLRGK